MAMGKRKEKVDKTYSNVVITAGDSKSLTFAEVNGAFTAVAEKEDFVNEDVFTALSQNLEGNISTLEDPKLLKISIGNNNKIYGIYPVNGTFAVRFVGFPHKEDGTIPIIKVDSKPPSGKRTWPIDAHREFFPQVKVFRLGSTPAFLEGLSFSLRLWYLFVRGLEDPTITDIAGKGREYAWVEDFLTYIGLPLDDEDFVVPFSDNVLPYIEKVADTTETAPAFIVEYEDGWFRGFAPLPG